jgi:hypothetical protein
MARLAASHQKLRFLRELRGKPPQRLVRRHRADYERCGSYRPTAFMVAAGELLAELVPGIRAEPGCWAPASASTRRGWRLARRSCMWEPEDAFECASGTS